MKGRDHLESLGIDMNIILKWILNGYDGKASAGFIWLSIGTGGFEHCNEP